VVVDGIVVAVSGEKNLTGKIIVHIGLPKTATTTLQSDFFPVFVNDFIEYWGVCQPRGKRGQSNAYFNFYRAVDTGLRVGEVRKELELKIAQGKTVIFSEEMITVSSTTSSTWREKLKNLGNILKGLQYDIVVTVRDPIPALFSYYVELHRDNYSHGEEFMDRALSDEVMEIFHYRKLTEKLVEFFDYNNIHIFKFEDLILNNMESLGRLISSDYREGDIVLKDLNRKKKNESFVYVKRKINVPLIVLIFLNKLRLLENGSFYSFKSTKIERPSKEDVQKLKVILSNETLALKEYFGISYE